jgi:hypothetical protein
VQCKSSLQCTKANCPYLHETSNKKSPATNEKSIGKAKKDVVNQQ